MLELFSESNAIFQDDNAPTHTTNVISECHDEHFEEVTNLVWLPQLPDLNTIEHLWCTLEINLRSRYPPLKSLKE